MGGVFLGIGIFALFGLILIGVYFATRSERREYEDTGNPDDELSDEQFRRIEFGDEDI